VATRQTGAWPPGERPQSRARRGRRGRGAPLGDGSAAGSGDSRADGAAVALGVAGALGGESGAADPEAGAGPDPEAVARQICLRMLASAPRTRAQLAGALERRGVPEEAAEAVLGRFAEVGLIDDATFASAWVESRHYGRGLSGRALAAELRTRGVPADDIRAAVDGLGPEQEVETARGLVERRLAATRGEPAPTRVRRLIGVLARKGYPQGLAYRLVREALEQEGVDLAAAGLDLSDPGDEPSEEEPGWERPEAG
jgi:regulatory protein